MAKATNHRPHTAANTQTAGVIQPASTAPAETANNQSPSVAQEPAQTNTGDTQPETSPGVQNPEGFPPVEGEKPVELGSGVDGPVQPSSVETAQQIPGVIQPSAVQPAGVNPVATAADATALIQPASGKVKMQRVDGEVVEIGASYVKAFLLNNPGAKTID